MTGMIEHVARALCREFGSDPDETGAAVLDLSGTGHLPAGQAAWTAWVDLARAAIEAMRVPGDGR